MISNELLDSRNDLFFELEWTHCYPHCEVIQFLGVSLEPEARATKRNGNPEWKTPSRKGPWRLGRTLATQTGMTNQWLKDQGLVSVKDLRVKTCPAMHKIGDAVK